MSKKYGSYSDEDLNKWERFPWVFNVLGSSAMGAWLYRRQGNIEGQTIDRVLEIIDKLDAEAIEDFELDTDYGLAIVHDRFAKARERIKALKGEHQS